MDANDGALRRWIQRAQRRVGLIVARCVVKLVYDAPAFQALQVEILKKEVRELERFQQYGMTSVPLAGAEGLLVARGIMTMEEVTR